MRHSEPLTARRTLEPTVAVVITTFNDAEFLPEALRSVFAQTRAADEIIVVDDGSNVDPQPHLAIWPQVSLVRKSNGGLSSARNAGLLKAHSSYITFLDADDVLERHALASGLECFEKNDGVAMIYGGHRRTDLSGTPLGGDHVPKEGKDAYQTLLTTNFIGMHATVMYRREVLLHEGGFDETLRACEDYELYLRLARRYAFAGHSEIVAQYRRHERNMSSNNLHMLQAVTAVHERHKNQDQRDRRQAWHVGQQHWQSYYKPAMIQSARAEGVPKALVQFFKRVARSVVRRAKSRLRGGRVHRLYRRVIKRWPPQIGAIRYGDFASTTPISLDFGYDRGGNPVDRYYIENWLESMSSDIRGRVLEVAEDTYSKRFGGAKITQQDVLHYDQPDPIVTILGDLTQPGVLPDEAFDCIILTQTLQLIFELEKAITRLHAALKPGGVLLLTVPGITQIERTEWNDSWFWSFTAPAVRKLFARSFRPEDLEVQQFGNVFAATTFLHGVTMEEIDLRKLDVYDESYPVIVTLRAKKS